MRKSFAQSVLLLTLSCLLSGVATAHPLETDEAQLSQSEEKQYFQELFQEDPRTDLEMLRSSQEAPVWRPFMNGLAQCAPGCQPVNYNAYRNQRVSCHGSGRALDVGGLRCGRTTHMAINRRKFEEVVRCMRGKMKKVIYRNGSHITEGHRDHGHFSLGCSVPGHPIYW